MYFSACIPALFSRMPVHEAVDLVVDAGLEAAEIWGWWDIDLDAFAAALQRTGMRCSAVCTRFIPMNDPARREEYINGLRETIAAAKKLGCRTIISQVGHERHDTSREEQHQAIVESAKACIPMLEEADVQLVIEPLNTLVDHQGYYLTSSEEGFEMVREIASDHVRLLYDIYHQQIMEGNLWSRISANLPLIGHIHAAGVPGRHEMLKNCEIHYPWLLSKIKEAGYEGAVGLEYFPLEDPVEGLREILALML